MKLSRCDVPCSMVQYVQDSRWFETKLSKQIFIPVRDVYIYIFIIYMICITCIYILYSHLTMPSSSLRKHLKHRWLTFTLDSRIQRRISGQDF